MAHPDLTDTTHPSLSYDGCGINGRDQYRTRIATFTDKRGPVAHHYGPLFAAAPELLAALKGTLRTMVIYHGADCRCKECQAVHDAIAKAEGKT
jgi:hypothetical protein